MILLRAGRSEKELQILGAIRGLIGRGCDLQKLRADDIAREAGVGKGTLYLYFDSKKDMIAETLFYIMQLRLNALETAAHQPGSFRERAMRTLQCLRDLEQGGDSVIRMLHSAKNAVDLSHLQKEGAEKLAEGREQLDRIIRFLLDCGIADGSLSPHNHFSYVRQAFFSAASGAVWGGCPECCSSAEEADRNALDILTKSLR